MPPPPRYLEKLRRIEAGVEARKKEEEEKKKTVAALRDGRWRANVMAGLATMRRGERNRLAEFLEEKVLPGRPAPPASAATANTTAAAAAASTPSAAASTPSASTPSASTPSNAAAAAKENAPKKA